MLVILIEIGDDRYVIGSDSIVEIIPYAKLRTLPHAPGYMAGLLNFRGNSLPVLDICCLLYQRPSAHKLSTRIIIVRYEGETGSHLVGLLCEGVTETRNYNKQDFSNAGAHIESAPYLGKVITDKEVLIQEIDVNALISSEVEDTFFDK